MTSRLGDAAVLALIGPRTLSSAIEPITQELGLLEEGRSGLFAVHFTLGYALNLAQVAVFRQYGFLAAITLRWAMYLVWHISYGNLICGFKDRGA